MGFVVCQIRAAIYFLNGNDAMEQATKFSDSGNHCVVIA